VVFPTPPFWFAMQKVLAMELMNCQFEAEAYQE
jgi:hypothetical protein